METISGTITQIRYHNMEQDGFFVLVLDNKQTCVGNALFLSLDTKVELLGEWQNNTKYKERQFRVAEIRYASSVNALEALLSSGFLTGIGPQKARELVKDLGSRTIPTLDQAVDGTLEEVDAAQRILCDVHGIGPTVAEWITDSWRSQRDWAKSAMECVRVGLSLKMAKKLHLHFGGNLPKIMRERPYQLTVVRGISWRKADEIAKMEWPGKPPIGHDSQQRASAAAREILRQQMNRGHTCYPETMLLEEVVSLAKPGNARIFSDHVRTNYTQAEGLALYRGHVYLHQVFEIEQKAAARLADLLSATRHPKAPTWEEVEKILPQMIDFELSDDQKAAVQMVFENPVSIITGGPGTGKTTVVKLIAAAFRGKGLSVTQVAPTGKAAIRMEEVTGLDASTIHRALGINSDGSARYSFATELVVVDETSMVDQKLFLAVIESAKKGKHIIFVGDVNQLPSVGPGDTLFELIKAGIPTATLTQLHRQGQDSGIAHAAQLINQGIVPPESFNDDYADFKIGRVGSNAGLAACLRYMDKIMTKYKLGLDDIQLLTTVNRRPWGQQELNIACQQRYNPGQYPLSGIHLRNGDRVIHLRNNYEIVGGPVMNGETGYIERISSDEEQKAFSSEKHVFDLDENGNGPPSAFTINFGRGKRIEYTRYDAHEVAPAYALTVHKSQGSEYPYVLVFIPHSFPDFMTRQLVYTAITRGQEYVMVISAGDALDQHIQNEARVRRHTCFAWLIEEAKNATIPTK